MTRNFSILSLGFFVAVAGCNGDDSAPGDSGAVASTGSTGGNGTTDAQSLTTANAESSTSDGGGDTSASTGASAGTTDVTASAGTTDATATGGTGETSGATTDATGGTSATDGTGATTGEVPMVCMADVTDDACATCVKGLGDSMGCCAELDACVGDTDCECFQQCFAMSGGDLAATLTCAGDPRGCNIDVTVMGTPTYNLGACTLDSCNEVCFPNMAM